jgi:hypothetical protein
MATAQDADLIIKLYQLRTDDTMRKARKYVIFDFFPASAADVQALFADTEHPEWNAYYRQVSSYWDMVAAMVNHGAIDQALFFDTNGEFLAIWAKIGDYIEDLRKFFGPQYMVNLEKLVAASPGSAQRIQGMKERFKNMAAARAQK